MIKVRIYFLLFVSLGLVACGGHRTTKKTAVTPPNAAVVQQKQAPSQAQASATNKQGGYYLDDGPGDNPPSNIDGIPDAVPRKETLLVRSNKAYSALGKEYAPFPSYQPYKQQGIASWYGKRYHNNKTSSGEVYNMYGMSAAHTVLPIPSYARVTNVENGRSVIVKINDRGPFRGGRLIDLSYAAAYKLRLIEKGSGTVEVEAIDPNQLQDIPLPDVKKIEAAKAESIVKLPLDAGSKNVGMPNFYVQTGAFRTESNADRLIKKLIAMDMIGDAGVGSMLYNDGLYRVRLGPYSSRQEAATMAAEIRKKLSLYTLIVNQ